MATWHQNKRSVKLYSAATWNVVIDPPNQMRCIMSFATEESAKAYSSKVAHSYILPPSGKVAQ